MPEPPNIIMIMCDELRADALGCYGNPIVETPAIDKLAERGTRFSQCFVTQPTCTPSRASILSGCYPSALRARMVGCYTPEDPRFLPRVLSRSKYRTASIGKLHFVPQADEPKILAERLARDDGDYFGFQEVDLVNGHGRRCFGNRYTAWLRERVPGLDARLAEDTSYTKGLNCERWNLPAEAHSSHYIADRAIEFLAGADEQPFFLQLSFPDPHYPFTVPEPYASRYNPADMPPPIPPVSESYAMPPLYEQVFRGPRSSVAEGERPKDRVIGTPPHRYADYDRADWQQVKAIYYGMVDLIDHSISRVYAALERLGLAANTVIVFLSDHGDYLGDHGFYGKGLPYESALRSPLIFSGPGIQAGHTIDSIESTLDIAPTLLDIAGIAEPEGMQGLSLRALLAGEDRVRPSIAMVENDDDFAALRMRTLITRRWRLTYYLNQAWGELIDRERDPQEMRNLWHDPSHAAVKQRLLNRLLQELTASIDMGNGRKQKPSAPIPKWRGSPEAG
ncbi:MAG: sulfatase-like hydrolase/transferase [Chloroflexi bacterium]|nr:sulfatase-like hydrolase/transferase [Chloroflexota bacterium]MYE78338.1 sulfatase-like hydrolase/transferase [Chloroflexota bacterium]MYH66447.1 sulfatase-like hydrolase/transferase [Chloroflexota bacterium]